MILTAPGVVAQHSDHLERVRSTAFLLVREWFVKGHIGQDQLEDFVAVLDGCTTASAARDAVLGVLPPEMKHDAEALLSAQSEPSVSATTVPLPAFVAFGRLLEQVASLRLDDPRLGQLLLDYVADDAKRWRAVNDSRWSSSYQRALRRMSLHDREAEQMSERYQLAKSPHHHGLKQTSAIAESLFAEARGAHDTKSALAGIAGLWNAMVRNEGVSLGDRDLPFKRDFAAPTAWQAVVVTDALAVKWGHEPQVVPAVESFRWWVASGNSGVTMPGGGVVPPTPNPSRFKPVSFVVPKPAPAARRVVGHGEASLLNALGSSAPADRSSSHSVR